MSAHEFPPSMPDAVPEHALVWARKWAMERPLQIALRHRRLGVWRAWRWIDVLREVERHADGLRNQGFGEYSRLALSGAFEPNLLILALAARSLGGRSFSVGCDARGPTLRAHLAALQPDFAFVQRRESVTHWLQACPEQTWPLRIFSAQAVSREVGRWRVLPLAVLLPGATATAERQSWPRAAGEELIWIDEGTEWKDGLTSVLERWLKQGDGLAFPETTGSSLRDRREAAPTSLLLSSARLHSLAGEIEARLAPAGSWRRRLCDWTLADPVHGLRRWIKSRVRRLLGFQRLRRIDVPARDKNHGHLASLDKYLGRAA